VPHIDPTEIEPAPAGRASAVWSALTVPSASAQPKMRETQGMYEVRARSAKRRTRLA